jgi:hypothetical protein
MTNCRFPTEYPTRSYTLTVHIFFQFGYVTVRCMNYNVLENVLNKEMKQKWRLLHLPVNFKTVLISEIHYLRNSERILGVQGDWFE